MADHKIRVLIVDDSALIRRLLTKILSSDPEIQVVGSAMDPYAARDKIKSLNPDVITLDIEMPKMDGLTFLGNLMRLRPMPVIMFSSLTQKNADATVQALALGAFDFIGKPTGGISHTLEDVAEDLLAKVKAAYQARRHIVNQASKPCRAKQDVKRAAPSPMHPDLKLTTDAVLPKISTMPANVKSPIVAIGASTGGVEALIDVITELPANIPATVITQHIPAAFSKSFAERLNKLSQPTVHEASDGEPILPGHVYVAPGSHHLIVRSGRGGLFCSLSDGPPVNRHRPSVDVMFRSVIQTVGKRALGVILTGMGDDGARGMKEMFDAGCHTVAQDKESSVVWGMPGSAVKLGAAAEIVSLDQVPSSIIRWITSA